MSATKELQLVDVEWAPADPVLQALQILPVTERGRRGGVETAAGDEGVILARKRGAHARGSYAPRTSLSRESLRLEEGKSLGARRERKQPEPSHPACTRAGAGASESANYAHAGVCFKRQSKCRRPSRQPTDQGRRCRREASYAANYGNFNASVGVG